MLLAIFLLIKIKMENASDVGRGREVSDIGVGERGWRLHECYS